MAFTDPPPVASTPTAGKGLALTLRGLLPFNKYGSGPASAGAVLLADGKGAASFAQFIRGVVTSTGTITAGTGFSVSHGGTGIYTVTFTTNFTTLPAIVPFPIDNSGVSAGMVLVSPAVSGFSLFTFNTSTGLGRDEGFSFIAVGT